MLQGCSGTKLLEVPPTELPDNLKQRCPDTLPEIKNGLKSEILLAHSKSAAIYFECADRLDKVLKAVNNRTKS